MTPEEVNRFLAIECMGWVVRPDEDGEPDRYFWHGGWQSVSRWNPYHSIADAMRVLDRLKYAVQEGRLDEIDITTRGGMWHVAIDHESHADYSLPAAISLAAVEWAKAKKGGE